MAHNCQAKLGTAVETVKRLLHAERVPQLAGRPWL